MNPAYGLALLASVLFGTGDFLGGYASRRASAIHVTFVTAGAGLVVLCLALPFLAGAPRPEDFAWGAALGMCGGIGVALLFRAFAIGPISVAAPLISVIALMIPVLVGMIGGERPSALALTGIALAAFSFPFLSNLGARQVIRIEPRVLLLSVTSGVLVGGFLVLMRYVPAEAGLAPLCIARLTTTALFAGILLVRRESLVPMRGMRRVMLASGILDTLANVLYFIAVHRGALAIVGTIVSLAPATTVLLARIVLAERWTPFQRAGLALAMAAIVCVSLG